MEDTTTLHRAGPLGLSRVRRDGRRLEQIIAVGGDYIDYLEGLNCEYIRMNLTMGGIADLVGLSYGCLLACGEIPEAVATFRDGSFESLSDTSNCQSFML